MRHKKIFSFFTVAVILAGTGCKKFLDVNKNENDPTQVPVTILLTSAERSIGNSLALGSGLSAGLSVYMHQQTTREAADQYGMRANYFAVENPWYGLYGAIKNLDVIVSQGTTEGRLRHVGVAKILRAYAYSQLVDVWGDVPFSEFNKFKEGVIQPKFDDDAAIYTQVIAMIDAGIADINNTAGNNTAFPALGSEDLIYQGNTTKWVKAANTLKLKLYTQMRKIKNVSAEVTALLSNPGSLINSNADMFVLPYGPLGATDDRNPGFGDYTASQRGQLPSPWFYEILRGYNTLHGTYTSPYAGIPDPRLPYYIYNQIKKSTAMSTAATNQTEYRDTAFVSLYFGSTGPNRNGSQQTFQSLFGIYPVGGRYDDLQGGTASAASGTGASPYKFITYADRLYLEAELINAGIVTGDAKAVFQAALNASFSQVDYVISTYVKPTQTVPLLMGANGATPTTSVSNYISAVLAKYDAASTSGKLQYIMTEKWKASFGSSVDQYTDYRRTGFPILFDPRDPNMAPGGQVQPPVNGNPTQVPQAKVTVARLNEFPLTLLWPESELEINSKAPAQKPLPIVYKPFWLP